MHGGRLGLVLGLTVAQQGELVIGVVRVVRSSFFTEAFDDALVRRCRSQKARVTKISALRCLPLIL